MGSIMMSPGLDPKEQQGVGLMAPSNNPVGSDDPDFSDFSAFAMSLEDNAEEPALDSFKFEDLISVDDYNTAAVA